MRRELTGREVRFIRQAKRQAPNKGDVFGVAAIGAVIGMSSEEAHDIVRVLERDFGEVGYLKRVPGEKSDGYGEGNRAVLTDLGRELPLQLAEDERAERRARVWKWAALLSNGAWALLVLFGMPIYEKYVERRFEQREQQRESTGASVSGETAAQPQSSPAPSD